MNTKVWTKTLNSATQIVAPENVSYMPVPAQRNEAAGTDRTSNVVLVDDSGSTAGEISPTDKRQKLIGEKEATTCFLSGLPVTAHVSVITFSDSPKVLFALQPATRKLDFIRAVQSCAPEGGTAMCEALNAAEREFRSSPAGYMRRLYLITDGMSTDGDPREVAERLKKSGVQIHCLGFGHGAEGIDERLMKEMASRSLSGAPLYAHFSSAQQLTGFLKRESRMTTVSR